MKYALVCISICFVQVLLAQGLDLGTTTYTPTFIANLSAPYNETSGLAFSNDTIFSINDSGNQPMIHAMGSSNGQHLQSWTIQNAVNVDWHCLLEILEIMRAIETHWIFTASLDLTLLRQQRIYLLRSKPCVLPTSHYRVWHSMHTIMTAKP